MTVQANKAQLNTLATLTRDRSPDESWEIEETNLDGVICLREFQVEAEYRDVLIALDGEAVAMADREMPTVVLKEPPAAQ